MAEKERVDVEHLTYPYNWILGSLLLCLLAIPIVLAAIFRFGYYCTLVSVDVLQKFTGVPVIGRRITLLFETALDLEIRTAAGSYYVITFGCMVVAVALIVCVWQTRKVASSRRISRRNIFWTGLILFGAYLANERTVPFLATGHDGAVLLDSLEGDTTWFCFLMIGAVLGTAMFVNGTIEEVRTYFRRGR